MIKVFTLSIFFLWGYEAGNPGSTMVIPNLSHKACQDTAKQYAEFAHGFSKFKAVCTEQTSSK